MITLTKELRGTILDIGGGGEGIIGRLYTTQVVAIDNRQEELDETPDCFRKIRMDATQLDFTDRTFDHVTSFYTLMFMSAREQRLAITEAARVLKPGGELHIWDCEILSAYPEPFCVDVEIQLPGEFISTTYGIGKLDAQSMQSITNLCLDAGLSPIANHNNSHGFYLRFKKTR